MALVHMAEPQLQVFKEPSHPTPTEFYVKLAPRPDLLHQGLESSHSVQECFSVGIDSSETIIKKWPKEMNKRANE